MTTTVEAPNSFLDNITKHWPDAVPSWVNDPAEGLNLNLGSNIFPRKGYVNVDVDGGYSGTDVIANLESEWPWSDHSVDTILAVDVIEHLRQWYEVPNEILMKKYETLRKGGDLAGALDTLAAVIEFPDRRYGQIHFMNEAWRVLKDGGVMFVTVPCATTTAAMQDPTHVSYWTERTLNYYLDDSEVRDQCVGVKARFNIVHHGRIVSEDQAWVVFEIEAVHR